MLKVLHLASWYPSRVNPAEGIFVRKHVEAVSRTCPVAVLYITFDPSLLTDPIRIEWNTQKNVLTVFVFLRSSRHRIPLITKVVSLLKYVLGAYKGLRMVRKLFGRPSIINVDVAGKIGMIAVVLKYMKRIPFVVIEHSTSYVKYRNRIEYSRHIPFFSEHLAASITFHRANAVMAVSKCLANGIRTIHHYNHNIIVIPNVVECDQSYNLPVHLRDRPRIKALTVSLLRNDHKQIDSLILAFAEVISNHSNLELHIVGDGPDRDALVKEAERTGLLGTNIFFHGYVPHDQLAPYFQDSNFFVLNSAYETFSVVTAEALAQGIPALVTKCGGPEEYLSPEFGMLVDRFDRRFLVQGIEYMWEHWIDYDPMRLRNYACTLFNAETVGKQFLDVYTKVIMKE